MVVVAVASTAASVYFLTPPGVAWSPTQAPPSSLPAPDLSARTEAQVHLRELVAEVGDVDALVDEATPLADQDASQGQDVDKEWDELPRTVSTIQFPERFLVGGVSQFPIHRLYRSPDLNPLDFHISKVDRDRLRVFVAAELKKIADLDQSLSEVGWHWLAVQIDAGSVQPLRFRDTPEVRSHVRANSAPGVVFLRSWLFEGGDELDRLYAVGGATYGVRYSDIPEAREADAMHRFMRQSLALRVGEWFSRRNLLRPNDWGLYVERVYNPRP